jgi:hypothetical protein
MRLPWGGTEAIPVALGVAGNAINWVRGQPTNTSFGHNALQFENCPFIQSGAALTWGNVILYGSIGGPNQLQRNGVPLGDHEEQHTYQAQWLGPFYIPSHLLFGFWSELTTGDWHQNNLLEIGPEDNPPHPWPTGNQWWERIGSIPGWWSNTWNKGPVSNPVWPFPIGGDGPAQIW